MLRKQTTAAERGTWQLNDDVNSSAAPIIVAESSQNNKMLITK
jgi:hypothetical protein